MSIIKNDFPILEFDTEDKAVIKPNHESLTLKIPPKVVFAFLGDAISSFAFENKGKIIGEFDSITKKYPVYLINYKNEEVCLVQAPVGAAASVQILDWLISYGAREIISAGSCGVLTDFDEDVFLVPDCALRDEGTSYHYLEPSRFIEINKTAKSAIEKALKDNGISYENVTTWSTDGFFRETDNMVQYRRSEGCRVVEMECSALAACAQKRGVIFGEILFTADSLANAQKYDERKWGKGSINIALKLSLDAVLNI